MANGHDGGVGGTRTRISDAHYRALKLQPLSQLALTAPYPYSRPVGGLNEEGSHPEAACRNRRCAEAAA